MLKKIIDFPDPPIFKKLDNAIPIFVIKNLEEIENIISQKDFLYIKNIIKSRNFKDTIILSDQKGNISNVIIFENSEVEFFVGNEISKLPSGNYYLKNELDIQKYDEIIIGFGLSSYKYDFYKNSNFFDVKLLISKKIDYFKVFNYLQSEYLVRNLINTPASDLGPKISKNI